jgi:gamma-aminobutyric acid receptor subunit beta
MNAGWIVVEETYDVGTLDTRSDDPLAKNERFVRFDYTIHVKRELGYYIWKVIGPLSFIVLMSYAVFWIDPAMAARQIGLASTSILTLVAFLFSLNAILPPLSYMTRMDAFLFASLALSFLAFAEAVVTAVLTSSERRSLALTMDRWARWLFPGTYALFHIFIWTRA